MMGQCARLFNGAADQTLYARVTPSPEQIEFLQTQWNELAEHLKRELSQQHGYAVSTWLQGSYKYATLIKPVHKGERYDVDLGVYFEWDPRGQDIEPTPRQLRDWVQRELRAFQAWTQALVEVIEPPKDRCSRAVYKQQFHINTPTYHLDRRRDRRRLANVEHGWEDRDPRPVYKWFRTLLKHDGAAKLSYSYQNHPKAGEPELQKHQGFCELTFDEGRGWAEGHYFNSLGRYAFGRMQLARAVQAA